MNFAAKLLSLVALFALIQEQASSLRVVRVIKYRVPYMVKGRPTRPFPRSFRLADVDGRAAVFAAAPAAVAAGGAQQPAVILLNETAVPFTVSKSALTTAEFEANPQPADSVEEGSGPAASFPDPGPSTLRHSPQSINEAGPVQKNTEPKIVDKTTDLNVGISEVHPVYVKPPTNFKPVIFATRRIDGVRSVSRGSAFVPTLLPPPMPYPYPHPRGVSSWTLGGTRSVQRGSFWESLATDEALTVPNADELASRSGKRKAVIGSKPISTYSWIILPNRRVTAYSKSVPVVAYQPVYSSKRVIAPAVYRHPLPPQRRRVTVAKPTTATAPASPKAKQQPSANPSSSSTTAIKSKLPVGLTSWLFGGVRDLNGKHWNMPEQAIEKVDVVPASSAPNNPAHDNKRDFFNGKELMTSDEVETFEPSASPTTFAGEVDESDVVRRPGPIYTNVYFDEESDNTVSLE